MSRSLFFHNLVLKLWPTGKLLNKAASWPVVGPLLEPLTSSDGDEAVIIPVQEAIQGTQSVVLPYQLLVPLVEQASERFILEKCLCRQGERCRNHPHDVGCIFLGDGATQINPGLGRSVEVDEAVVHLERGLSAGLMPLIVHNAFDAWLLGIPYRRMLSICFCCQCCCSVHQGLRLGPQAAWEAVLRLPGLNMVVADDCTGCGECVEVCLIGAATIQNGRARIGDLCKGCGRCAAACPSGVISLQISEGADTRAQILARIAQRTDIGLAGHW